MNKLYFKLKRNLEYQEQLCQRSVQKYWELSIFQAFCVLGGPPSLIQEERISKYTDFKKSYSASC